MPKVTRNYRRILEHNVGFDGNTRWLPYARRHGFKKVSAARIGRCPDCAAAPTPRAWGQYVYFSTLIRLLECSRCGLVWADAHLDPRVVRQHFDVAYKDDSYFRFSRNRIFRHMARVIDNLAPRGAHVLDIGGARGDLMAHLADRRPDLYVVVNDIADASTGSAAERFGFATLTGDAQVLANHEGEYDVVVLSDVLYYEPDIRLLWRALGRLVAPGGRVVIRVPNKWPGIRFWQRWYRTTRSPARQRLQDRIRFFNPEHIFILRPKYLKRRLERMGFRRVHVYPSPLLATRGTTLLSSAMFAVATALHRLTRGAAALTPSILVVGIDHRAHVRAAPRRTRPRVVRVR
ncbi:MAG: methyltransferase domain-containing protein [Gemmatimonadaceae bacterium]